MFPASKMSTQFVACSFGKDGDSTQKSFTTKKTSFDALGVLKKADATADHLKRIRLLAGWKIKKSFIPGHIDRVGKIFHKIGYDIK